MIYKFLEDQEGRKLNSYLDTAGVWTIGVGSTMYKTGVHVKENETITNEQADELMKWEVANKSKVINSLLGDVELNDNQMIAIISFTYNMGIGALEESTLLKVIKSNSNDTTVIPVNEVSDKSVKNWMLKNNWLSVNKISLYFMVWNKVRDKKTSIKKFSESILKRRIRESKMYFS